MTRKPHFTRKRSPRAHNLTITGIAALTGFVSLAVVLVALVVGLWIDGLLGRRGPATICLLVASVPVSLYLMIRIALGLVGRLQLGVPDVSVRDDPASSDSQSDAHEPHDGGSASAGTGSEPSMNKEE